jgi:hypothetical protein
MPAEHRTTSSATTRTATHARPPPSQRAREPTKAIDHLKALVVTAREELAPPAAQHAHRRTRLPLCPPPHAPIAFQPASRHGHRAAAHRAAHPRGGGRGRRPRIRDRAPGRADRSRRPASVRSAPPSSTAPRRTRPPTQRPAFAILGGPRRSPPPPAKPSASRVNRPGDRRLTCALHTIVLTRLQHGPATRAYAARRLAEGRTRAKDQTLPQALPRPSPVAPRRSHRPTRPPRRDPRPQRRLLPPQRPRPRPPPRRRVTRAASAAPASPHRLASAPPDTLLRWPHFRTALPATFRPALT